MIDKEEQQNSNGGTPLTTAIPTPWTLDAPEHMPHLRTKKNDKGFKVDFASAAIKRGTLPDTAHNKDHEQQKHLHQPPQSLPSKLKDQ